MCGIDLHCGERMASPTKTGDEQGDQSDKEKRSGRTSNTKPGGVESSDRPQDVDKENEGGSETRANETIQTNPVPSDVQDSEQRGTSDEPNNGSDDGGGQDETDSVGKTISRYVPMELQRQKTPAKSSNSIEQVLRERIERDNPENQPELSGSPSTDESARGGHAGLRDQSGQEPGGKSLYNIPSFQQFLNRKVTGYTPGNLNKNEIIALFRSLPLEVRLEESVRTLNEFRGIEKRWKSVIDGLALTSDKYKEAVSRKPISTRLVERIVDAFEGYLSKAMAGGISVQERDRLKQTISEVLMEEENEGQS
ncbi:hypothetical protein SFV1gp21 [Sulfolobus filamentous virus 1]|uniref:Uncharacterized protein n=2 Tax=Alphalipothrixvirus beppuense TaxID=2734584 RepID=A0A346LU60_SUFV1|nr:hypothetical protein HOT91_gp21 [Sulfolobus filamentous virus 1]AXQ00103.1 hypothetical protein SFV1gp21 [Sulfolobus filamentous virus 1]AZI75723.1 hypothetical protein SBFV1_gp22 [Sulfolobales Beppu filamentous phage 1]